MSTDDELERAPRASDDRQEPPRNGMTQSAPRELTIAMIEACTDAALIAELDVLASRVSPESAKVCREAADRIAALAAELAEMKRERAARNAIDPTTRLHNLCDRLAESRRESPYDEESWRLADEDNAALRARATKAEAALAALTVERDGAVTRGQMMLDAKNEWSERAREAEAALAERDKVIAAADAMRSYIREGRALSAPLSVEALYDVARAAIASAKP